MNEVIDRINSLRQIPDSNLNVLVKKVAIILTSSRSGSSLIKSILDAHPDIAALDGEIEPLLTLSRNGFGFNSDSDAIDALSNKQELINNILDGLTVNAEELPSFDIVKRRWEKRLLLQFPELFSDNAKHKELLESLDTALSEMSVREVRNEKELQDGVLNTVFQDDPWRINYYDGYPNTNSDHFFGQLKIEEPPFVSLRFFRRSFSASDAATKTLLFKSPSDVYRNGMYEQLFPNADIKYIHLTRGFAQSVNGLMDGWLSPRGFFSHNLEKTGIVLNIHGYSDTVPFGKVWWKFDLPPNWKQFISEDLENVCLYQWIFAQKTILQSGLPKLRVSFESFLSESSNAVRNITDYLGLKNIELQPNLPAVMAIETPKPYRWRKRENIMLKIGEKKEVQEIMNQLGYTMKPETWL